MADYKIYRRIVFGGWECIVPDDEPESYFSCFGQERPFIMFDRNAEGVVGNVFTLKLSRTRNIFLSVFDQDEDGDFDSSHLDVPTDQDSNISIIGDVNLDGEPDWVIEPGGSYLVRFEGELHHAKIDEHTQDRYIEVNRKKYFIKGKFFDPRIIPVSE